jgi:hypothetical protein
MCQKIEDVFLPPFFYQPQLYADLATQTNTQKEGGVIMLAAADVTKQNSEMKEGMWLM